MIICYRADCIVGLRDVLKAIGAGQASLVVCDRNPNPPTLTKLLVPLCQLKEVPLVALKNFTTTVKKLLHIPRCLTLAFKVFMRNLLNCAVEST